MLLGELKQSFVRMFADNSSGLVGTVPIYLSEISSPEHRGLIGGISGCGIAFGTMVRSKHLYIACTTADPRELDVQLGWLCLQLRILWTYAMEVATGNASSLGSNSFLWARNFHARFTSPTPTYWQSR